MPEKETYILFPFHEFQQFNFERNCRAAGGGIMTKTGQRINELLAMGYACSQIVMIMGLESPGQNNPVLDPRPWLAWRGVVERAVARAEFNRRLLFVVIGH